MQPNVPECLTGIRSVFFIGIGGISMSSLAMLCRRAGLSVAGSDRVKSQLTEKLAVAGIPVYEGHDAAHLDGFDAVVYTGAIADDNPELTEAKRRSLPIIYRAALLGDFMKSYPCRIGVAGMHGKSTATGMIAHLFASAGKDPTVVSGAVMPEFGGAYRVGGAETFVFEACEYKNSFLDFFPTVAVILNLDLDHTDFFADMAAIRSSFARYAAIADGAGGLALVNGDDENALLATADVNRVLFGFSDRCRYRASDAREQNGRWSFAAYDGTRKIGDFSLAVPGKHQIYNALAAIACGDLAGLNAEELKKGIETFSGVARRMEYRGTYRGADVILDYAHHPRELEATLAAARAMTSGRVLCAFEPHTYSRTAALYGDFCRVLSGADMTVLLDVYAARETDTMGIEPTKMANEIRGGVYAPSYEAAAELLKSEARPGDVLLILGAGTIDRMTQYFA